MAELLQKYPTPQALRQAGQARVAALVATSAPRLANAGPRTSSPPWRADRGRRRHRRRRYRAAPARRAAGPAACLPGPGLGSKPSWRPTSSRTPDVHAHGRRRDGSPDPRRSRRQGLRDRRASGILLRLARNLALRDLDPREPFREKGQQDPQTRVLPLGVASLKAPSRRSTTTANDPKANATTKP
jgi:hypothetical protein